MSNSVPKKHQALVKYLETQMAIPTSRDGIKCDAGVTFGCMYQNVCDHNPAVCSLELERAGNPLPTECQLWLERLEAESTAKREAEAERILCTKDIIRLGAFRTGCCKSRCMYAEWCDKTLIICKKEYCYGEIVFNYGRKFTLKQLQKVPVEIRNLTWEGDFIE